MESWSAHTPAPNLKFEHSPTESLLSTPDEMFPSLFGNCATPTTLNPVDMMTPESYSDRGDTPDISVLAGMSMSPAPQTPGADASGNPDKKPAKKRKSWGQVLPEPKTNLPPRKRAKTEDEKEQRRVERVLRNRRAAQSSRERKRQEVEGLERRNKQLEDMLLAAQRTNEALIEELRKFQRQPGGMARVSTTFDALRPSPITFSQELFSSHDGHTLATENGRPLEQLLTGLPSNTTVDPSSLSPTLTPIPEAEEQDEPATSAAPLADAAAPLVNTSPDATQHPAEMLWLDLQCRSAEATPSWLAASQQRLHPALALLLPLQILLTSTSTMVSLCQRPLTQIAMSLKAGFSLPPTPAILKTIILLVTNPSPSRMISTLTTSSPTTTSRPPTSSTRSTHPTAAQSQTRRSSTLRLKFLRKILTCSPTLARPLMDATMEALRLASSEGYTVDRVSKDDAPATAAADGKSQPMQQEGGAQTSWLNGAIPPSKEVLMTLWWVLRAEERRLQIRQQQQTGSSASKLVRQSVVPQTSAPAIGNKQNIVLKVKRSLGGESFGYPDGFGLKRRRVE
jgi:transcriptional activator HAC1